MMVALLETHAHVSESHVETHVTRKPGPEFV